MQNDTPCNTSCRLDTEMPTLEGPNAGGLPSLEGPNAGGKVKMLEVYIACYNFYERSQKLGYKRNNGKI